MNGIKVGRPLPLGSSITSEGVNFSLIASKAEYIEILLFDKEDAVSPKTIFKLNNKNKTGNYWHAEIKNLKEGSIYAYRIQQKNNELNKNHSKTVLIDPCSRGITGWSVYKRKNALNNSDNIDSCLCLLYTSPSPRD